MICTFLLNKKLLNLRTAKAVARRINVFAATFAIGWIFAATETAPSKTAQENSVFAVQVEIAESPKKSYACISKPNPLLLVVKVDTNQNVRFNREDFGRLEDFGELENRLREIFVGRVENKVYREDTNIIEKTVIVSYPRSLKSKDLTRLVKTIQDAGATPVKLDVNDLLDQGVLGNPAN